MLESLGLGSNGGSMVVSGLIDYLVPFSMSLQGRLFKEQKKWQQELDEEKMNILERMETRRLRCLENIENRRAALQKYLQSKQIEPDEEITMFEARAMRQTKLLMTQENASSVLQDQLLQDALRTFPLNVSPLVLLKKRDQSLSHQLAFSEYNYRLNSNLSNGNNEISVEQLYEEVEATRHCPGALNIFVAPVYVDSKIKDKEALCNQIWDTVYQRMESFFTANYNRSGDHPVIFYPTAWNEKYNPGMNLAENLHFFMKGLPCIVIEPRFDGATFRMVLSAWGLGYNSTIHHRTELNFPINIYTVLACSVYERSKKALDAIKEIEGLPDFQKYGFGQITDTLQRNVDLFRALHIEERIKENRMEEIEALGLYNIFKIEPAQDLAALSEYLYAHIGMNLAMLADIHHLCSYDINPILPQLLKPYFPTLYKDEEIRIQLFREYKKSYLWLCIEETDFKAMRDLRKLQMANVKNFLDLSDAMESSEL